ncbi:MAG: histidine kinase [Steroidobacteraceae bacterium]
MPRAWLRRRLPAAVDWALIVYAVILCAGTWGLAAQNIQTDYRSTMQLEREHLRSVSGTLKAQVEAMLGDGVGAALAAVNELENRHDVAASNAQYSQTLADMLTGGEYVRSLFLVNAQGYFRAGRFEKTDRATAPPAWLLPALTIRSDAWVGGLILDPDNPSEQVVPIARRELHGELQGTWAGALIAFRRLESVYRQTESGSGVELFADDGTALLLPLPEARAAEGSNFSQLDLFKRASLGPDSGVLEGIGPFIGRPIIVAYNNVAGYPIKVFASGRLAETLAPWYGRLRWTVLLSGIVTIIVIATTWMLSHFMRALRRRELHYRTLFNNAAFGALVVEGDRIRETNRTAATMFGMRNPNDLINRRLSDLSPKLQPGGTLSEVLWGQQLKSAVASFEWICQRPDSGAPFFAAVDLSSLDADGKMLTLVVIHDVTERKRVDQDRERVLKELQELAATLVKLQDDERRRIGRELHDSTGQNLAALELALTRLAQLVKPSLKSADALLTECVTLARQCTTEIRTASYLLHPPLLDEIGLLSALRWLADGLRQRSNLKIELELPATMNRLPPEQELVIFRVAQEALTNVHRHSQSPSVTIRLLEQDDTVILEVEDAGHGILVGGSAGTVEDVTALGVGLAGMRERMRQLGGALSVNSSPRGTTVQAKFALVRAAAAPAAQCASL